MTTVEIDEVAARHPLTLTLHVDPPAPIRVHGKFFFAGEHKHFVRGVTYGPFAKGTHGTQFPEAAVVEKDLALMEEAGVNTVRVFSVPPIWLLDAAHRVGLKVLVGLSWPQHIAFLDSAAMQTEIRETVAAGVRDCRRHPGVFGYLVGNEIPPDMVRWHGAETVRQFVRSLVKCVKDEHPAALVSYANFPSTEYLTIDFTDFVCFNVYLHDEGAFRRYIARLHNLAVDQPLVLTEFGVNFCVKARRDSGASFRGRFARRSKPASPELLSLLGLTSGLPEGISSRIGLLVSSTGCAAPSPPSAR